MFVNVWTKMLQLLIQTLQSCLDKNYCQTKAMNIRNFRIVKKMGGINASILIYVKSNLLNYVVQYKCK